MLSKAGSKYHVWIANRNSNPSTRWNHSQKLKIWVCAHHPLYTMFYEKSEKSQDIILYGSWTNARKERGERWYLPIIPIFQPFLFFPASVVTIIKATSTTMRVENRPRILKNTQNHQLLQSKIAVFSNWTISVIRTVIKGQDSIRAIYAEALLRTFNISNSQLEMHEWSW